MYHYTSIEGFKGIIESKEIWATVADYIASDPTEITHAKKIALEILRERKRDFNGKEELYNKCQKIIEGSDSSKKFRCICSFSEKGDLLSQWRGYCPKGGVSIGFSGDRIKKNSGDACIQNGTAVVNYNDYILENYLYKCIYHHEEQKKKMHELINFRLKHADPQTGGFFWKMIQTFSYTFKHESFEEEKEWRLCYFPEGDRLKYRLKNSISIPYWPFLTIDHNNESIISKIIIGPSRYKENLRKYISLYLKDLGIPLLPQNITLTKTPYQIL